MVNKVQEWDDAIEHYKATGVIDATGMTLVMTSCPTCVDTGMDDGSPCHDCKRGRSLLSPEQIKILIYTNHPTHRWWGDDEPEHQVCKDCFADRNTLDACVVGR